VHVSRASEEVANRPTTVAGNHGTRGFSRFGFSHMAQGLRLRACPLANSAISRAKDVLPSPCQDKVRQPEKMDSELKYLAALPGTERSARRCYRAVTGTPPEARSRWLLVLRKKLSILYAKTVLSAAHLTPVCRLDHQNLVLRRLCGENAAKRWFAQRKLPAVVAGANLVMSPFFHLAI